MYYTTIDFAELVHISPCTISKRVNSGIMPTPDNVKKGQKGRPVHQWLESTVLDYKDKLTKRLVRLTNTNYSLKRSCEICGIQESQAQKLINDHKNIGKSRMNGYELFIQTSSKLGVN